MEPLDNNFILTEKSSTSILLKFWGYFWLQDFRGSKKGSIYVCPNLPMSHLIQFKAWNEILDDIQSYSFENLDFSDFKARPQGMVNFGGSNLGSKVPKILFS